MSRLLALVLSLLLPAAAWGQGVVRSSRSCSASATSSGSASLNAVLYAAMDTPGCYASGSTALAVNGSGTPVAMTFSRASSAYWLDTPTNYWRTCTSNQARVGGLWTGLLMEPPGNNLLQTPTDSPTGSGNWSLMGAGTAVTQNNGTVPWLDGTSTVTTISEQAGSINGISQSVTVSTNPYFQSAFFYSGFNRQCWGMAVNSTVYAKFDILSGKVTYKDSAATTQAGIWAAGQGWVWAWVKMNLTAGTYPVQFFAAPVCTDNSITAGASTGWNSFIARTQFSRRSDTFTPDQPYMYVAAGTTRAAEQASFPVSLSNGNVCLSAKIEPYASTWDARSQTGIMSAYGATATFQAANSIVSYMGNKGQIFCEVYDSSAAVKRVTFAPSNAVTQAPIAVKCCTNTSGTVSLGYNGTVTRTTTSGAGSGIITTPPTTVYLGTMAGSGNYNQVSAIALSDVVVCGDAAAGDPSLCGNWAIPTPTENAAIGDSITVSLGWATSTDVTSPWPAVAAATAGTRIASIGRASWYSYHALPGWQSALGHRYKKIAVAVGVNDINVGTGSAADAFNNLRQLYQQIIASGATPLPMTILPSSTITGAREVERLRLNEAILGWCTTYGFTCADSASFITGHPEWFAADNLHLNQAGETALGGFMAPYFQ